MALSGSRNGFPEHVDNNEQINSHIAGDANAYCE